MGESLNVSLEDTLLTLKISKQLHLTGVDSVKRFHVACNTRMYCVVAKGSCWITRKIAVG